MLDANHTAGSIGCLSPTRCGFRVPVPDGLCPSSGFRRFGVSMSLIKNRFGVSMSGSGLRTVRAVFRVVRVNARAEKAML